MADNELSERKNIRLKDYDYSSPGAYFIKICTHDKTTTFGEVGDSGIVLSTLGEMVLDEWIHCEAIREEIELDEFVVMPDHFHGIVAIHEVGATGWSPERETPGSRKRFGPKRRSLGSLIAGFKSSVSSRINRFRGTPGKPVWQRGYYEHVIRNPYDLENLRNYILNNPWKLRELLRTENFGR